MMMDEYFKTGSTSVRLCGIIREQKTFTLDEIKVRFRDNRSAAVFIQTLLDLKYVVSEDGETFHYVEGSEDDNAEQRRTIKGAAKWLFSILKSLPPFSNPDGRPLVRGSPTQPLLMKYAEAGITYYFAPEGVNVCNACNERVENYGFLVVVWNPGHAGRDTRFYTVCEWCSAKVSLPPNHIKQEIYPFIQAREGQEIPKPSYPLILTPSGLQNATITGGVIIDRTVNAGREDYTFQEGPTQIGKPIGEAIEAKDRIPSTEEGLDLLESLANAPPAIEGEEKKKIEEKKVKE